MIIIMTTIIVIQIIITIVTTIRVYSKMIWTC